jgi:hypothetical protein
VLVIAGADVRALISYDREKQLLGCTDSSCLTEIGGALGVDYILSSEVSEVGGVLLVSMTLIDVGQSRAEARVVKRANREKDLVDVTSAAVREALARIGRPAQQATAEAAPVQTAAKEDRRARKERTRKEKALAEDLKRQEKQEQDSGPVTYKRRSTGLMVAGIVMVPVGLVAAAGGLLVGVSQPAKAEGAGKVLLAGALVAVAGIPLWIIGASKKRVVEPAVGASDSPDTGAALLSSGEPTGVLSIGPGSASLTLSF